MIKDNHREMAKFAGPDSIARAVRACRQAYPRLEIEVEADTLEDVAAAAAANVEYILLDNMSDDEMREAIRIVNGRARTEASGNITLERLPRLRGMGLDFISCGALTHSAPAVDIGLDILN
jgi:nicotinate-nucleotide pyrophosphorylase (carboxylating)